jgi:hypothetical protein
MMLYTEYDKWILWLQDTKNTHLTFDTEMEARLFMSKLELAQAVIYQTQLHIKPMDEGQDILQWYFDSGYTYTDADLESLGITASQLISFLTFLENAKKFYAGENPANAVYRVTVNTARK